MIVKDQTWLVRAKVFLLTSLVSLVGMILYNLIRFDFDFSQWSFELINVIVACFIALVSALSNNKVRFMVVEIDNFKQFVEWLQGHFKSYNGELIYQDSKELIFEVVEEKKAFLKKERTSYYEVKLDGVNAIIEGPTYKIPKLLR
ncbi:hypothetical protein LVD15_05700 [Fulvivirga maritima]|uniref:hypothetical protein n=1 Tax=Fulvivirga maritima TaxID=2904247 RepID=UPI001F1882F9|nr:hypothetical protein [Fulvivirga maritima]UII27914.1 hypothetical protein LVD15_05700 [Fulvivirga maritima]